MIQVAVPADKSIAHRAAIFSALNHEPVEIKNFLFANDTEATLDCLRNLGIEITQTEDSVVVSSGGVKSLCSPAQKLDAKNSGTTARLLLGLLSGVEGLKAVIIGDSTLMGRPMKRVAEPLSLMGLSVSLSGGDYLPAEISGSQANEYTQIKLQTASAQVKSALLLASYASNTRLRVSLPVGSRNHTENMIASMGGDIRISFEGGLEIIDFDGREPLQIPPNICVPGDPSSAAIIIFAAMLLKKDVQMSAVLNNPTRNGFYDQLDLMGCQLRKGQTNQALGIGEQVADFELKASQVDFGSLKPIIMSEQEIRRSIDEVPLLIILSAFIDGVSRFSGLAELKVKESDRLMACCKILDLISVKYGLVGDELHVTGNTANLERIRNLHEIDFDAQGDHRIVMIVYVLSKTFNLNWLQEDPSATTVSFPNFLQILESLA